MNYDLNRLALRGSSKHSSAFTPVNEFNFHYCCPRMCSPLRRPHRWRTSRKVFTNSSSITANYLMIVVVYLRSGGDIFISFDTWQLPQLICSGAAHALVPGSFHVPFVTLILFWAILLRRFASDSPRYQKILRILVMHWSNFVVYDFVDDGGWRWEAERKPQLSLSRNGSPW